MTPGVARILVNGSLAGLAAVTLFPLVWMVAVSLMAPGEASTYPPPLTPNHPTLDNYRELFARAGMGRYLFNSVLLAASVTLLSLLLNVAAGYAFAKLRFAGRERIFKLLLGTVVIPGQVAMIPLFLLLKELGLVNSYGGVIVPVLKPIIVTLAVFTLLGTWNDFMWPLIVLSDKDLYTLPVALASLSREHVQDNELMMAGSVVTTLPVLVVFVTLQRYYIEGLMAGSVKG